MTNILVSGLINIETTVRVDRFPIRYYPVRYPFFGLNTTVSGVGYNLAKALTSLGNSVQLLSLIGHDPAGVLVEQALAADKIAARYVLPEVKQTAQSVILYDGEGRRQINVDLKDIQEQAYPEAPFQEVLATADLAVLCNINFSRPFLEQARAVGCLVATDVHTIGSLDDAYNRDFMAAADILFMSNEALPCPPELWAQQVLERHQPAILVIGLGAEGALLAVREDGRMEHVPAIQIRPIVSTIGAGDALFAAFLHCYGQSGDPYEALRKAAVFAAYKIGTAGAAEGFLGGDALEQLYREHR